YSLVVRYNALCGDGQKQGTEGCDGGSGCTSTCDRVPSCGDGFVDAPEQCDDGNTASGDGCSAPCQYETLSESEPSDPAGTANGPYTPNVLIAAAVGTKTDVDYYAIHLPVTADLRIETFDAKGPGSCVGIDTVVTVYGADGTTALISRDQG